MVSPVVNTDPDGIFGINNTPPNPQLSFTVGGVQVSKVSHLLTGNTINTGSVGQLVKTGAVTSCTKMVKVQVEVLPKSSVAV